MSCCGNCSSGKTCCSDTGLGAFRSSVGFGVYGDTPSTAQQLEAMRLQQKMQLEQQRTARVQAAEQGRTDRERAQQDARVAARQASAASFSHMMQSQQQRSAAESANFQQMMSNMTAPRGPVAIPGMQRRGPSGLAIGLSVGGGMLALVGIMAAVLLSKK